MQAPKWINWSLYKISIYNAKMNCVVAGNASGCYSIDFADPKNNKNHRSSMYSAWDSKGHLKGRVTLKFKVTRGLFKVTDSAIALHDLRNPRNKKKIIALTCIVPEIAKVTCKVAWPWSSRSRVVCTRSLIVPLHCTTWENRRNKKKSSL